MITQGIWKAAEKGTIINGVCIHRVFVLNDNDIAPANGYGLSPREAEDNARLIAASKDILEALKDIIGYARNRYTDVHVESHAESILKAELALAKAEV